MAKMTKQFLSLGCNQSTKLLAAGKQSEGFIVTSLGASGQQKSKNEASPGNIW